MKIGQFIVIRLVTGLFFATVAASSHGQSISITVPSDPLWTDSGVYLDSGESVSITASGTWSPALGQVSGPEGFANTSGSFDNFYADANWAALIGYVGADPYQGNWGDGNFFPQASGYFDIGSGDQFVSLATGELWLGFNDDAVSEDVGDNYGSVTARVNFNYTPVPEPSVLGLLAVGAAGLVIGRRWHS